MRPIQYSLGNIRGQEARSYWCFAGAGTRILEVEAFPDAMPQLCDQRDPSRSRRPERRSLTALMRTEFPRQLGHVLHEVITLPRAAVRHAVAQKLEFS